MAGERHLLCFSGRGEGLAAAGEDVQADVAAHFCPLVVLLGQHGADQAVRAARSGNEDALTEMRENTRIGVPAPTRSRA
jgi:hypothetical protein